MDFSFLLFMRARGLSLFEISLSLSLSLARKSVLKRLPGALIVS